MSHEAKATKDMFVALFQDCLSKFHVALTFHPDISISFTY